MPNHKSNLKLHSQIMNHFPQIKSNQITNHICSTVYMAALDARKVFDRVSHVILFKLLLDNNVPPMVM